MLTVQIKKKLQITNLNIPWLLGQNIPGTRTAVWKQQGISFHVFKSCLLSYHLGGSVVVNIQGREKRTWWSCFRALWRCRRRGPRWVRSTCAAPRRTGALDDWLLDHVGGGLPLWMVPTPKVSSTSHLSFWGGLCYVCQSNLFQNSKSGNNKTGCAWPETTLAWHTPTNTQLLEFPEWSLTRLG